MLFRISATAVQRGGLTALTLMALLLNRNTFNDPADPEAGLAGFAFAITIAGIGITIGAIVAPFGVKKIWTPCLDSLFTLCLRNSAHRSRI